MASFPVYGEIDFLDSIKKEELTMKKKIFVGCLVLMCLLAVVSQSRGAEVIKLSFATFNPPTHPISVLEAQMCDEIKKRTNGQVQISYYPGGTLAGPTKIYSAITEGIADIGMSALGYTPGRFPLMDLFVLPLGFPSAWVVSKTANDFYNKFRPKEFDDVRVFYMHLPGPFVIQTMKKPVKTLEDLKGMRLRAIGVFADTLKALGGTPIPLEMPDVYESLRRGVLDGNFGPMEMLSDWKIGELEKYVTASWKVGNSGAFYLAMNKQKWNNLPPEIKKVFEEVTAEYSEKIFVARNESDIRGREFLKKNGGQIIELSETESARWVKAVQPVIAEYKKGLVAKGFSTQEIDGYLNYITERVQYWRQVEKKQNIPTPYN